MTPGLFGIGELRPDPVQRCASEAWVESTCTERGFVVTFGFERFRLAQGRKRGRCFDPARWSVRITDQVPDLVARLAGRVEALSYAARGVAAARTPTSTTSSTCATRSSGFRDSASNGSTGSAEIRHRRDRAVRSSPSTGTGPAWGSSWRSKSSSIQKRWSSSTGARPSPGSAAPSNAAATTNASAPISPHTGCGSS